MDILIIILLILLNGLFAMSEVALISARKSSLRMQSAQGSRSARRALALAEDPDKFLSTVQIGITLIGILTGIFSGAAFADNLGEVIARWGVSVATAHAVAQGAIVVVVTYLSIVFGELVPKRIGMNAAEREEPNIVEREDGTVLIDGRCPFYDFLAHYGLEDAFDHSEYNTISGLILDQLGHIPSAGEEVAWSEFSFEIVDMDSVRIDKVLVKRVIE